MELLTYPHLSVFYPEADEARAKRTHLEQIIKTLAWIAQIDAFQHWIYTHPSHTREERSSHWLSLEERFGSKLNWKGLERYRSNSWQKQLHLYEVPFYYIEYGIAQLGALQLWLQSLEDKDKALQNYKKALALGGSKPLPELFQAAGLEFRFDAPTVSRLIDQVDTALRALPQ